MRAEYSAPTPRHDPYHQGGGRMGMMEGDWKVEMKEGEGTGRTGAEAQRQHQNGFARRKEGEMLGILKYVCNFVTNSGRI